MQLATYSSSRASDTPLTGLGLPIQQLPFLTLVWGIFIKFLFLRQAEVGPVLFYPSWILALINLFLGLIARLFFIYFLTIDFFETGALTTIFFEAVFLVAEDFLALLTTDRLGWCFLTTNLRLLSSFFRSLTAFFLIDLAFTILVAFSAFPFFKSMAFYLAIA
jgi:hypothetical protein